MGPYSLQSLVPHSPNGTYGVQPTGFQNPVGYAPIGYNTSVQGGYVPYQVPGTYPGSPPGFGFKPNPCERFVWPQGQTGFLNQSGPSTLPGLPHSGLAGHQGF